MSNAQNNSNSTNMTWLTRLSKRWGVNVTQAVLILIVFACTGFTIMFLKKPILHLFTEDSNIWISIAYYVLILPIYNIVLLFYGFLFGQFKFFLAFEKRFLKRILNLFKSK